MTKQERLKVLKQIAAKIQKRRNFEDYIELKESVGQFVIIDDQDEIIINRIKFDETVLADKPKPEKRKTIETEWRFK